MTIVVKGLLKNIIKLKQKETGRIINIDLNSLDTVDYNIPSFSSDQDIDTSEVTIKFTGRNCWMEPKNVHRRKCYYCGKGSDTTYCKKCWNERY